MDRDEIRNIRRTWAAVTTMKDMTSGMFYNRLFAIAPDTRALFKGNMAQQRMKLVTTLDFIVDHLDQLDRLVPDASELAIRHVAYGVAADQYVHVGEALIWTMKQVLGPKFSEADEKAWVNAYTTLSQAMIEVAYPETIPTGENAEPSGVE